MGVTYLPGVVQFSQAVAKHVFLSELLEEGLPPAQLVVLLQRALEQAGYVGVVGKHEARHTVGRLDVRTLLAQGHLQFVIFNYQ